MVTSTRAFLAAVIVSLAVLAALLQLPAPVQAQSSTNIVPAGPAVSGANLEVLALAAVATTTGPTASGALEGAGVSAEAPRPGGGSAAKNSAGLSALAVLMLVLIVAGTALMGSRKS